MDLKSISLLFVTVMCVVECLPQRTVHLTECNRLGYYRNGNFCQPCLEGTYKHNPLDDKCTKCPPGTTTEKRASYTITECIGPCNRVPSDDCPVNMIYAHPGNCTKYIVCANGGVQLVIRSCAGGSFFDAVSKECVSKQARPACMNSNCTIVYPPSRPPTISTDATVTKLHESTQLPPKPCGYTGTSCIVDTKYPYSGDCHKYIICSHGGYQFSVQSCPRGTVFSEAASDCERGFSNCVPKHCPTTATTTTAFTTTTTMTTTAPPTTTTLPTTTASTTTTATAIGILTKVSKTTTQTTKPQSSTKASNNLNATDGNPALMMSNKLLILVGSVLGAALALALITGCIIWKRKLIKERIYARSKLKNFDNPQYDYSTGNNIYEEIPGEGCKLQQVQCKILPLKRPRKPSKKTVPLPPIPENSRMDITFQNHAQTTTPDHNTHPNSEYDDTSNSKATEAETYDKPTNNSEIVEINENNLNENYIAVWDTGTKATNNNIDKLYGSIHKNSAIVHY